MQNESGSAERTSVPKQTGHQDCEVGRHPRSVDKGMVDLLPACHGKIAAWANENFALTMNAQSFGLRIGSGARAGASLSEYAVRHPRRDGKILTPNAKQWRALAEQVA